MNEKQLKDNVLLSLGVSRADFLNDLEHFLPRFNRLRVQRRHRLSRLCLLQKLGSKNCNAVKNVAESVETVRLNVECLEITKRLISSAQ